MENESDKHFVELLRRDGAAIELCQVCVLWGLVDTSVEHSLKAMSKNMASTKGRFLPPSSPFSPLPILLALHVQGPFIAY
jgi:hypothetical protein